MKRLLAAGFLTLAAATSLRAQSPPTPSAPVVFRPVASTGNLLTTESRKYWMTVVAGYRTMASVQRAVAHNIGDTPIRLVVLTMFRPISAAEPPTSVALPRSQEPSTLSLTP